MCSVCNQTTPEMILYACGVCGMCLNARVKEWAEARWERYLEILSCVRVGSDGEWIWPEELSRETMRQLV